MANTTPGKLKNVVIIDPVGIKAGMDSYNDSLAAALKMLDVNVRIFSNYRSEFSEPVFKLRFAKSILFVPEHIISLFKVFSLLKAEKPDVVILHFFKSAKAGKSLGMQLKQMNIKLIIIVHDIESLISESTDNSETKNFLLPADEIVVHNKFTSAELLKKFPEFERKVTIIPHGHFLNLPSAISKTDARKKLNLNNSSMKVLFFGMIKPSKGMEVLLKAMQNSDAQLIIAGRIRKHSISDYTSLMSKLEKEGRLIKDINYISNEKRDLYFKAADIIVLPYRKIYQSGVLLMAMSYGLPVIASDLEPNKELAGNVDCIELFPEGDSIELERMIAALLKDEGRMGQLRTSSFGVLKRNHNWEMIADRFKQIISR